MGRLQAIESEETKHMELASLATVHLHASTANTSALVQWIKVTPRLQEIGFYECSLSTFYQCILASPTHCATWRVSCLFLENSNVKQSPPLAGSDSTERAATGSTAHVERDSVKEADLPLDFTSLHTLFSHVNLSTYRLNCTGDRRRVRPVYGELLPWLRVHYPTSATLTYITNDTPKIL